MEEKRGKHSQTIATAADWPARVILLEDLTRERAALATRHLSALTLKDDKKGRNKKLFYEH